MLTLNEIREADRLRGEGRFRKTLLHHPASLNRRLERAGETYLKLELLQRTGSFKARGAMAKVLSLGKAEQEAGVIAASAGNHGQGVALAAAAVGAPARIVMPAYAPLTKRDATEGYGAEVILAGASFDEAHEHALALQAAEGGTFIHAFDDERVMAGQGTIGLEILEDLPEVGTIVCPVGGGGLVSGVAVAAKTLKPDVRVVGVQAEGASSAVKSFHVGYRVPANGGAQTIADGIKVVEVGERCLDVITHWVDEMVTVSDTDICKAMLLLDEHAHVSAEPAGAAGLAALLDDTMHLPGPVVVIVSGGNIDTFDKTRYINRALAVQQRHLPLRVRIEDRRGTKPDRMARLFRMIAEHDQNILDIEYHRDTADLPLGMVEVELLLETRGEAHAAQLLDALTTSGWAHIRRPVSSVRGRRTERGAPPRSARIAASAPGTDPGCAARSPRLKVARLGFVRAAPWCAGAMSRSREATMTRRIMMVAVLSLAFALTAGCGGDATGDTEKAERGGAAGAGPVADARKTGTGGTEETLTLDQVPEKIKAAARKAVQDWS